MCRLLYYMAVCVRTIKGWPHWTGALNVQVVILCGSLCEDHQRLATLNRWPQCAGCYIVWQFVRVMRTIKGWPHCTGGLFIQVAEASLTVYNAVLWS